jgi:ketosteroid isomerase-like protein
MRTAVLVVALNSVVVPALMGQSPSTGGSARDEGPPAVVQTLRSLQHEYAHATVKRDTVSLRRIEPPDATFQYPDGATGTGKTDFAAVASGAVAIDSFTVDSLRVRVLAPTVAVITGHARIRGNAKLGNGGQEQDLSGEFRFIDVWQRRAGQWQIAAEQYTKITSQ